MELVIPENILKAYELTSENIKIQQIGSGHINRTYLLNNLENSEKYILQSINTHVFQNPLAIAENIELVSQYLKTYSPNYLFPAPLACADGKTMVKNNEEYWRLSPFVAKTVALDTLFSTKQAYEAAKQFAKLSRLLNDFDTKTLSPTITGFHDLSLRYNQFTRALSKTTNNLREDALSEITLARKYVGIVDTYQNLCNNVDFPDRVMHHDTKISNVLLDEKTFDGACVIDLDTLMPGKFISDLGDMMRTYLCEFSENEGDLSKITIRMDYFEATIKGYLTEMSDVLTATEKDLILFSGKYIIYMQALRFLTDYLNGSVYYPIKYPTQNLDRAKNQFKLLSELFENEQVLQRIIKDCLN